MTFIVSKKGKIGYSQYIRNMSSIIPNCGKKRHKSSMNEIAKMALRLNAGH